MLLCQVQQCHEKLRLQETREAANVRSLNAARLLPTDPHDPHGRPKCRGPILSSLCHQN